MNRIFLTLALVVMAALTSASQVESPPIVTVPISPMGITPITVQPGYDYRIEIPPTALSDPGAPDLGNIPAGLKVTPVPNSGDGMTRYDVTTDPAVVPANTEVQVSADKGAKKIEMVVVKPTPTAEPAEEHHHGEDRDSDWSRWPWVVLALVVLGAAAIVIYINRR